MIGTVVTPMNIEGLAAQLYVRDHISNVAARPWWHCLRESIKRDYRKRARQQLEEFDQVTSVRGATP